MSITAANFTVASSVNSATGVVTVDTNAQDIANLNAALVYL